LLAAVYPSCAGPALLFAQCRLPDPAVQVAGGPQFIVGRMLQGEQRIVGAGHRLQGLTSLRWVAACWRA
jgi:hypothetical protein